MYFEKLATLPLPRIAMTGLTLLCYILRLAFSSLMVSFKVMSACTAKERQIERFISVDILQTPFIGFDFVTFGKV